MPESIEAGRYLITVAPTDSLSLLVRYLGYGEKRVTGVAGSEGGAIALDVAMQPAAPALEGIEPAAVDAAAAPPPPDPQAEVARLRALVESDPGTDGHRLDLALALLRTGATDEAGKLLDALPANLATDERTVQARARLDFAAVLADAPAPDRLEAAIEADPSDLRARHLLGVHSIVAGDAEAGLEQFIEMLRRDRDYEGGLPRKALIDAFQVVEDPAIVGRYRRKMASLLF